MGHLTYSSCLINNKKSKYNLVHYAHGFTQLKYWLKSDILVALNKNIHEINPIWQYLQQ